MENSSREHEDIKDKHLQHHPLIGFMMQSKIHIP